ncbi:MAG: CHAT domain-containing protein [bacterium]|nr:CHAT domain-containing protein [bacterium]
MRLAVRLLPLLLLAASAAAQPPAARDGLPDSLLAWRSAGRPDMVDSLAGPAITAARAAGDTTGLLNLLLIRGATRASFGMARQAEGDLREGMAVAVVRRDTLRHLQCLRWLGVSVGTQGRGAEATDLYAELARRAEAAADSLHLGWAWVGIAYGHYLQGRAVEAGATYARAAGVLQRYGETRGAVWAWNGRGLALRQAGDFRGARTAFANVLALVEGAGDAVNEAMALDQLGRLDLMLGDPGRAVDLFARSVAIHRESGHRREGLVPSIDLAKARVMQGRYVEAEAVFDSVLAVCREYGLRDLEVLAGNSLADTWLEQGRPGAAADHCRRVLGAGEMLSRLLATETRLRLARALIERDSLVAAATTLARVLEDGAGATSLELRVSALLGVALVDSGDPAGAAARLRPAILAAREAGGEAELVVLLTHLARAEAALDRPDSALAVFGRAIANWERVRAWPTDPVWREHRGTVSGSLFANAAAVCMEAPGGLEAAWEWIQRYKARTLRERMLGPGAGGGAVAAPDLADFRRQVLKPDEVFLDLVEGDRLSVLFCVTRDTAFVAAIPGRREIEPRLRRLADVVRSPALDDPGPAVRLAGDLVAAWPASIRRLAADAGTVWWCPDGSWHRLPAALLPWRGASTRIPGAGVLARLRHEPPAATGPASILAVAGPDSGGGGPLPGAEQEIAWLTGQLRHVRTPVEVEWAEAGVLHLAAHTMLHVHQPWLTGITLGPDPDDVLRAADVAALPLNARLAVLAGCTTAGTRVVGGEGLIGLAGGFLAANVPAVLATLWPVDDAVAFRVTTQFYEGLADGLTAAAALDRARHACFLDPETCAPRHWAAFVLVGDGDITVPLQRRSRRWPWAAALALFAIGAWIRARR